MAIPPRQVIDMVVALEKDLSTLYRKLQLKTNLKPGDECQHEEFIHREIGRRPIVPGRNPLISLSGYQPTKNE